MPRIQEKLTAVPVPYTPQDLRKMSPEDRKRFARAILLKVLRQNPDGLSSSQIEESTGLDPATVSKHLEYLVAIRELYKRQFGVRTTVYFPNGRLMHPTMEREYRIGERYYHFSMLENPFGRFLYIQERTKDEYNIHSVAGGLVVRADEIEKFVQKVKGFAMEMELWKKERKNKESSVARKLESQK